MEGAALFLYAAAVVVAFLSNGRVYPYGVVSLSECVGGDFFSSVVTPSPCPPHALIAPPHLHPRSFLSYLTFVIHLFELYVATSL